MVKSFHIMKNSKNTRYRVLFCKSISFFGERIKWAHKWFNSSVSSKEEWVYSCKA